MLLPVAQPDFSTKLEGEEGGGFGRGGGGGGAPPYIFLPLPPCLSYAKVRN